ncbi:MAG: oligosaccharide flippase family protein [Candidatus Sumerlaeia bacterium]
MTVRHIAMVLAGNVVGNAMNLAALLLLAHWLDDSALGVYGTMFFTMVMMSALTDFGINTTIVKYYREAEESGRPDEAESLLRASLWVRLAAIGAIAIPGMIFAGPLAAWLFKKPEFAHMLRLICLGALGGSAWMFSQGAMQARRQFNRYATITASNHALRLAAFCALAWAGRLSVNSALIATIAVPFIGAAGAFALFPDRFWSARIDPARLRERVVTILHLSKWVFLSTIIVSIMVWLSVYLLNRYSTEAELGQYTNALNIAQGIHLLTAALATVLLPNLSVTRSREKMLYAMSVTVKSIPWIAACLAVLIAVVHMGVPYLHGGQYGRSAWVFDLLAISFSIAIVVNPLSFFCLAFERARWLTWMNLAQLAIAYVSGRLLIPHFGAIGAGLSSMLIYVFALVFMLAAFKKLLRVAK